MWSQASNICGGHGGCIHKHSSFLQISAFLCFGRNYFSAKNIRAEQPKWIYGVADDISLEEEIRTEIMLPFNDHLLPPHHSTVIGHSADE